MIVYEEEKLSEKQQQKKEREERERVEKNLPPGPEEDEDAQHREWRKKYISNLLR